MRGRSLLEEIGASPKLGGAACAGLAPLFDARGEDESRVGYLSRFRKAEAVCATCAVFEACEEGVMAEEPGKRSGIWAAKRFGRGAVRGPAPQGGDD